MSIEQQPVSVEKLAVVTLVVADQQEALDWYQDTLGFEVRADAPFEMEGKTGRWLTISPPGNEEIEIALIELDVDLYDAEMIAHLEELHGSDPVWTFTTSDMDAAVADLQEKGVDVDDEIRDMPYGRFTMFRELDGNSLQLHQPVEMDE